MKTEILNKEFVINPKNKPFFTGFGGSLFEIFNKPDNEIQIIKQLTFISSHYITFSLIKKDNITKWYFWDKEVNFYELTKIYNPEYWDKPEFVQINSNVYNLMQYLENNSNVYYLCYFSSLRHKQFNYILKTKK